MGIDSATMNSNEARNQIEHMKQFIMHEASEQQKEIENKAQEEFYLEKDRITGRERAKLTTECLGGVILHNKNESIVVDQTFNARLNVCMERATPIVKPLLFGEGGSKHLL